MPAEGPTQASPAPGPSDPVAARLFAPRGKFAAVAGHVLDLVYPAQCEVCSRDLSGEANPAICRPCFNRIARIGADSCPRCGAAARVEPDPKKGCAECSDRDFAFSRACAAVRYEPPLRDLLLGFKFAAKLYLGPLLAELLTGRIREASLAEGCEAVVAVPLTGKTYRERGFNQAEYLAGAAAQAFRVPLLSRCLVKVRQTEPQATLSADERRENLRGAFCARRPAKVRGRTILLIDDVLTTGATLSECAAVLKSAGAKEVRAAALARRAGGRKPSAFSGQPSEMAEGSEAG